MKSIIEIKNIKKIYEQGDIKTEVLKGIDLNIYENEITCILGPSGSGKTTLLNIISGIETSSSGEVFFNTENISNYDEKRLTEFRRDNVSFVFQQYNLVKELTALENVKITHFLSKEKDNTPEEILDLVGLSDHKDKFPQQMSGGQQQRVAIARAIAKKPKVLFCDEPTGALDEESGRQVLEVLKELNKKNTTIVMITHNPNIADICNRVINISSGKIISDKKNKKVISVKEMSWG